MTSHAIDTAFRDAVFAAAAGEGDDLARILRSDAPLGPGEREMLAIWAEGWDRRPGKRSQYPSAIQRWAAIFYIERTEAGEASDAVLADMKELFGLERSTLLGWTAEIRKFEETFPQYAERHRDDIKLTCASGSQSILIS